MSNEVSFKYELQKYVEIFENDKDFTNALSERGVYIPDIFYGITNPERTSFYRSLAQLLLYDIETISENNIDDLWSIGLKVDSLRLLFPSIEVDYSFYKIIMYTFKYSTVKHFFLNNYSKFLPYYDSGIIYNTKRFKLFLEAFMREYDRFAQMIDGIYDLVDIDKTPNEFISYLVQLVGYERGDEELLSNGSFRQLAKNIIEIYKIKGTNYSFELFFNFLGFQVTLKEYWFDKRYQDDGIVFNEFTGKENKSDFMFYLTTKKPTTYVPKGMKKPVVVMEDELTSIRSANWWYKYIEEGYSPKQLLGEDKRNKAPNGESYTYFKTNLVEYEINRIRADDFASDSLSEADTKTIKSYIDYLTPIFIYKILNITAKPFEDYASNLKLSDASIIQRIYNGTTSSEYYELIQNMFTATIYNMQGQNNNNDDDFGQYAENGLVFLSFKDVENTMREFPQVDETKFILLNMDLPPTDHNKSKNSVDMLAQFQDPSGSENNMWNCTNVNTNENKIEQIIIPIERTENSDDENNGLLLQKWQPLKDMAGTPNETVGNLDPFDIYKEVTEFGFDKTSIFDMYDTVDSFKQASMEELNMWFGGYEEWDRISFESGPTTPVMLDNPDFKLNMYTMYAIDGGWRKIYAQLEKMEWLPFYFKDSIEIEWFTKNAGDNIISSDGNIFINRIGARTGYLPYYLWQGETVISNYLKGVNGYSITLERISDLFLYANGAINDTTADYITKLSNYKAYIEKTSPKIDIILLPKTDIFKMIAKSGKTGIYNTYKINSMVDNIFSIQTTNTSNLLWHINKPIVTPINIEENETTINAIFIPEALVSLKIANINIGIDNMDFENSYEENISAYIMVTETESKSNYIEEQSAANIELPKNLTTEHIVEYKNEISIYDDISISISINVDANIVNADKYPIYKAKSNIEVLITGNAVLNVEVVEKSNIEENIKITGDAVLNVEIKRESDTEENIKIITSECLPIINSNFLYNSEAKFELVGTVEIVLDEDITTGEIV